MTPTLNISEGLRSLLHADALGEREGKILVSPQTTEDVAAITRYANEHGLSIEIIGAGTKRGWGNPVNGDILLATTSLVGVRQHSWQDLTATVAAGTPWAAMQQALAAHNQQVALDPLWPETATVGGIIATNDSGSLRLKYGSLRDLIIGMTIVLADGTVAKSGGKVVKNVAGYDLHKLMTGAYGTLGVITEVTFRLHPIPATTATWAIPAQTLDPLRDFMMGVLDSHLSAQAMQLRASPEGLFLDIQVAALSTQLSVGPLWSLAQTLGLLAGVTMSPHPDPFTARQRLFSQPGVILKATMLPSSIAILSGDVVRLGGTAVTQATGVMFVRFPEETAVTALPFIHELVNATGAGWLSILRMPRQYPSIRGAENVLPLMREIKRRFDPNRILNPSCFIGGI